MMEHLVAAIRGLDAVIHNNQTKIVAQIKTIKETVGSLASRIDANQEKQTPT
jgi:hypothetical protein